jgi:hypothetical protein
MAAQTAAAALLMLLMLLQPPPLVSGSMPSAAGKVTITPWCDNSMRVRISPPGAMPASAQAAQQALAKSLADKNMTDLAGAMVTTTCKPGAAVAPAAAGSGAKTTSGNLVAALGADGRLSFTRADTGALLFAAKPSFRYNGDASNKPPAAWKKVVNQTVTCSGSEYQGDIGHALESADACLAAVKASGIASVNYAIYNSGTKGCYLCDMADRGPYKQPSSWGLTPHPGAVSWVNPTPLPAPGGGYFSANLTVTAGDKSEVVRAGQPPALSVAQFRRDLFSYPTRIDCTFLTSYLTLR